MSLPDFADFPVQTYDKLRYRDTDRQGHVNNAVFMTFLETGRVELLAAAGRVFGGAGRNIVVAHMSIDFRRELLWPGTVEIGSAVMQIGLTSLRFRQALFQKSVCAATAESVIVQVDEATKRPAVIEDEMRARLEDLNMRR